MKIDTLILSGASTRGVVFFGCLDYLIENNLIDKNLKNIKKILCVSASFLFVLTILLLDYDYEYIKKLLKQKYNVENMSLLKLYKLTGKHIVVKVVNVSKDCVEYIDHINIPKMNILKLFNIF